MTTVRLIRDSYPYLKGTEFVVTGGDDGFWSRYAFHSGTVIAKKKSDTSQLKEVIANTSPQENTLAKCFCMKSI